MSTYVIGDIQGCYDPLRRVLDAVEFAPEHDALWSVGDLVNRGPDSLAVLRFLRSLGPAFAGVLGNHDLHFLAVARGARAARPGDTLSELLAAPERDALVDWLERLPFAIYEQNVLVVHAGVLPGWTLAQALGYAHELERAFATDPVAFVTHIHGAAPHRFEERLVNWERLRTLCNVFTRVRFCDAEGILDLDNKLGPEHPPAGMLPWYAHPQRALTAPVLFGHWAALGGRADTPGVYALDTACVWGGALTLLRLGDWKRFSCACLGANVAHTT